jgi:hypothetical protein
MTFRPLIRCCRQVCATLALVALLTGCGATKSQRATEQLLVSDAVDRAIGKLDFRDLSGRKVFFDTQYVKNIKNANAIEFVNEQYVISGLRQQLAAANCLLQDKPDDADIIVEARVGALGLDANDVVYGLPANSALNSAAAVMPQASALPSVPELAVARRNNQSGAAKIAVFAYDRRTKQPIWQSGISQTRSTAKDTWVLGAGPFQRGTIYEGTRFAGARLSIPLIHTEEQELEAPLVSYQDEMHFQKRPRAKEASPQFKTAGHNEPDSPDDASPGLLPPTINPPPVYLQD